MKTAAEARRFTIALESPLPADWPKPSLPGLVRIKTYPPVRSAWVRSAQDRRGQFTTLSRHIQARKIAMTSPVVMEYASEAAGDAAKMGSAEAMAFLYRRVDQDKAGRFGAVAVGTDRPVRVVSVGVKGAYTTDRFRKALSKLRGWLDSHKQWRPAAAPRVLAYHSPTMPFGEKYSEVQIPVYPADDEKPEMPPLSDEEKRIVLKKGTERAFTGKYWNHFQEGVYACRQCGAALYVSDSKFRSHCGWPSFDAEVPGSVKHQPDADGERTEITCVACGGHLGHVFRGEGLSPKNVRHCVNSASLVFLPAGKKEATQEAVFAGGCFWGVEHQFQQVAGVLSATSGYTGGHVARPTYEQVCTGRTGHAEAVRVVFDPDRVSFERLARLFFEIHDPTQPDRQGPDAGSQYRSAVFYLDAHQKQVVEKLIAALRAKGYDVATQVAAAAEFYPAEDYHQDYFEKHPQQASCQTRVPRFDRPKK